ncbi:hypothetical protein ABB37_00278 [Leptomonas pyrrhocoris]|uniref:C3H1-type domain-containing protein n=1 Tax=Leptomonas pyrrhocoris TaxID=157538 RepID=A0A0M9GAA7_LEPPY|nr:hypothetical protein ABB37_00278 [Leptomonas pyrrhocoris]XP_015664428.1 hypothetical protein ABB37_00278 [Leptomonas pyrrhocoris]KPA85988.1 hypothetical protein ABB37_00278 [Leptomonas pyrrhocoris]KPA85989.1 hypothetical protein ABB37_00278 [Leptomonas pyrrhocoris]|eukprot:XP_015664427.1 hypothetical protein ABB37_00278 [Leptomonas pyrrhocoris]
MTNQTRTTFSAKKAAAEHQKRVLATAADGEDEKHILASRYKTKMCKNYIAKGECPYEVRCMFAHGERELRSSEENIRDGLVTEEAIKSFQRQQNQAKRRATYAAAHGAEARAAATAVSAPQQMYVDGEESEEVYYHNHNHNQQQQQHEDVSTPHFIPRAQSIQHPTGFYTHNPYAFNIIPTQAREFAAYEETPEETYWYEEPVPTMAAVVEDYYFPSSDMMAPLVPNSVAQRQQQQQQYNSANKMHESVTAGSFSEEAAYCQSGSTDYSAYAPKAHCTAAEMPNYSDEVPMVLEP